MPYHFSNNTFMNSSPAWANACVGDNGSPGIVEYAEGFASAAQVLLEQVLRHRGLKYPTDTFVYPICFNMRHAIELYLKAAIASLESLAHHGYRLPEVDLETSHDIGRLWDYFKEQSITIDRRYRASVTLLDSDVRDFAEVDATGQVFRYPFGRENQKHLTELSIINLGVLWRKFTALIENLKQLSRQGARLEDEYRYKTYTAHLSRFDLVCIAYWLPPRDSWKEERFNAIKSEIRQHFKISSNEFSRAIKVIEKNIEMSALIEAPQPLLHLRPTQLHTLFDTWLKLHSLDKFKTRLSDASQGAERLTDVEIYGDDHNWLEELRETARIRKETWPTLAESIAPEAFGEIKALFYFSRNSMRYSEEFLRERDIFVRDFVRAQAADDAKFRQLAFHFLNKTSVVEHVLNTLRFFGHLEMVAEVLHRYELIDSATHLLEDSSRWLRDCRAQASEVLPVATRQPANEKFFQ